MEGNLIPRATVATAKHSVNAQACCGLISNWHLYTALYFHFELCWFTANRVAPLNSAVVDTLKKRFHSTMTGLLWWASRRTWTTKWNYVSKQLCFSICCPLFVPPVNMLSMCCDSVDLNLHDHSSHLFSFHTSVHPPRHTPCPAESLLGGHSHDISRHLRLCPAVDKQSGVETFTGPLFVVWLLSCFIGRWCLLWGKTEKNPKKT